MLECRTPEPSTPHSPNPPQTVFSLDRLHLAFPHGYAMEAFWSTCLLLWFSRFFIWMLPCRAAQMKYARPHLTDRTTQNKIFEILFRYVYILMCALSTALDRIAGVGCMDLPIFCCWYLAYFDGGWWILLPGYIWGVFCGCLSSWHLGGIRTLFFKAFMTFVLGMYKFFQLCLDGARFQFDVIVFVSFLKYF